MLRFWYLETLVEPIGAWISEPWFSPLTIFRTLANARDHARQLLADEEELADERRDELAQRWKRHFGAAAPPIPQTRAVCRLVEAKGQERVVGHLNPDGRLARRRGTGAPAGRALCTRTRRTFYLLAMREALRGRVLVFDPRVPWHAKAFLAFRSQKEALAHKWDRRGRPTSLLRVDASLRDVERKEGEKR